MVGDIRFLRIKRISDPARTQLATIDAAPTVQGWMICNAAGEVGCTSMPGGFDQGVLDSAGKSVLNMGGGIAGEDKPAEIEIDFAAGSLLARGIGNGWLAVFCGARTNLAMVRVTLSVTAAALNGDRALRNELSAPLEASFASSPARH